MSLMLINSACVIPPKLALVCHLQRAEGQLVLLDEWANRAALMASVLVVLCLMSSSLPFLFGASSVSSEIIADS